MTNPTSPSTNPPQTNYTDYISNEGFEPGNLILAGSKNLISNSMRCSILNGSKNTIDNLFNTHIIGNYITADDDNKFYIGCVNGMWVGGDIQSVGNAIITGSIFCDGDVVADGDITAANFSDERLKDDISLIENPLSKIMSLDAIQFNWNNKQSTHQGHDIGLIAQQVEKIAPEIVQEKKSGYKGLKYEKVIPLLVGAIQEQEEKIKILNDRVEYLLRKVDSMS